MRGFKRESNKECSKNCKINLLYPLIFGNIYVIILELNMYSMHQGEIIRLASAYNKLITYGEISKWGRLRALPVADEASKKEWQRSKFDERERVTNFGHRNRTQKFNMERYRSGHNTCLHVC